MNSEVHRKRSFYQVLVNTFIANLTTSFLWFALTFWVYLETRSVLATSLLGGGYLLGLSVMAVPFGTFVDHHRKKVVMVGAQLVTAVAFLAALAVFLLVPTRLLLEIGSPAFWLFTLLVLAGAVVESARVIALATTVTLLVPDSGRARANGLVGIVNGLSYAATSVLSGLAIGQLGMAWSLVAAVVLTVVSLVHLVGVRIPEPEIVHVGGEAPRPVDFAGAWQAIRRVPALVWLIAFSTLNNLVGGVFMGLLDPYGLTLMRVEAWGLLFGVLSFGFIVGGTVVARFGLGVRPLRSLMAANALMWVVGAVFTVRESIPLLAAGILVWLALSPFVEAAEQTVLQRVVPYETQGRVFGLAQAVEVAAAPVSAFLIGPIAQFGLIPYMRTPDGRSAWGWLLGDGEARGIALVFVLASAVGLALTLVAWMSRPYRTLSHAYAAAAPRPGDLG